MDDCLFRNPATGERTSRTCSASQRDTDSSFRCEAREEIPLASRIGTPPGIRTWILQDECPIPATIRMEERLVALACGNLIKVEEEFCVGVRPYLTAPGVGDGSSR